MPSAWMFDGGTFRESASVSPFDRGFRYGMSVFETFGIHRGKILFFGQHTDRLTSSARAARIPLPDGLPEAIAGVPLPEENSVLRVYATAGPGAPCDPVRMPSVYAILESADFPTPDATNNGVRAVIYPHPIFSPHPQPKTGNYWPRVEALSWAREGGFDESLVTSSSGRIISASMANVFFVRDGALHTPPVAEGNRDGVVRAWVKGETAVTESSFTIDDIGRVEECFITNSRIGVLPVREISGRPLPSMDEGRRLAAQYREKILQG